MCVRFSFHFDAKIHTHLILSVYLRIELCISVSFNRLLAHSCIRIAKSPDGFALELFAQIRANWKKFVEWNEGKLY